MYPQAKALQRLRGHKELENQMSLALRGEVAAVAQRQWVGRIWYLKEAPDNLLRDVSQMLNAMVMAPRERGRRSGMKLRPVSRSLRSSRRRSCATCPRRCTWSGAASRRRTACP